MSEWEQFAKWAEYAGKVCLFAFCAIATGRFILLAAEAFLKNKSDRKFWQIVKNAFNVLALCVIFGSLIWGFWFY